MSLQKPTIVLFDMVGTTVRHLNPALLSVLETLDDSAHKIARLSSRIFNRKISAPPLVGFQDGKRKKLLVHRAIHKIRRKEVDEIVEPCPGIYDILDLLKAANIPLGLISNGIGKGYGHDILEKFDLAKYYDVTVFREDIRRSKPYPDPILQALELLPRKPDGNDVIWYFGDRRKDVLAALAAASYLPCPIHPFAYNLNAAMAILEHNIGVENIIMAWPDLEPKLRALLKT
ncbi:MAG: HAD family hydrolase [Alphaproteobacteria bacterium]|nr:HAD family hydrolase [Alphaproteobacteria bacterium]